MAEFFKRQHIFIVSENNEVLPREFVIDDDGEFVAEISWINKHKKAELTNIRKLN